MTTFEKVIELAKEKGTTVMSELGEHASEFGNGELWELVKNLAWFIDESGASEEAVQYLKDWQSDLWEEGR